MAGETLMVPNGGKGSGPQRLEAGHAASWELPVTVGHADSPVLLALNFPLRCAEGQDPLLSPRAKTRKQVPQGRICVMVDSFKYFKSSCFTFARVSDKALSFHCFSYITGFLHPFFSHSVSCRGNLISTHSFHTMHVQITPQPWSAGVDNPGAISPALTTSPVQVGTAKSRLPCPSCPLLFHPAPSYLTALTGGHL